MGFLSAIATLLLHTVKIEDLLFPDQMTLTDNSTYDYIIAGGGTAGCVLAKRLVDANYSVLLLETGGNPNYLSVKPASFYALPETSVDHDYKSILDQYAAGGQGNHTRLTSGNMLGGSSSLNHLLWLTGPRSSYDNWAKLVEDDSWSYDELLKYIIKSENVTDSEVYSNCPNCHGKDGPIGLMRQTHKDTEDYLAAYKEIGCPTVLDLNANGTSYGCTQPLLTIANGTRQSTATTYLQSVKDSSNLYVSKNTRVSKVIIEDNIAVGVKAIYKDSTYTFKAKNEVILSAGTFNTPQILMLSGVGPEDHLKSLNITVIANLPVGDNLIVPPAVSVVHKTKSHLIPIPSISSVSALLDLTTLPFSLFVGSTSPNKSSTEPVSQSYNLKLSHDVPLLLLACTLVYGYETSICTDLQTQVASRDALLSVLVNFNITSRGSVRLNSTDPEDEPLITTGFYDNKEDLDSMIAIVKDFVSIVNTTFFKEMNAATVGLDLKACADLESNSNEFWKCYILNRTISPFIYTSTCAMGNVVDTKLKVKGVNNLRVVDASVFTDTLRSATNAAVIAVAEKAADMIIADA